MTEYLKELCQKVWSVGRLAIPGWGLLEFFNWLLRTVFSKLKLWALAVIADFKEMVGGQLETLGIDLAPGPEMMALIAKANVIVPLEEAWHYLLLYLATASVVVGVKWARNLLPGAS